MIIVWSDHKAGFVRRQSFILARQKFLNPVYTVTSADIIPPPVVPGIPGPVRILTPWAAGDHWIEPDFTITQRARVWVNRVSGFESRLGTIETEISAIIARLDALEDTSADIVEVEPPYQILPENKIISSLGTGSITLPNFADALTHPITITSVSGTITVQAEVNIQSPITITTGSSATYYPARNQWFHS